MSVLLAVGLIAAPAFALRTELTSAASALEPDVRVGPARVRGPSIPTPVDPLLPPFVQPAPAPTTTTTTTTRPPGSPDATMTPAPSGSTGPPAARTQTGRASWYRGGEGRCAHRTIPIGTAVTVTNTANGRAVRCTITNRGPYHGDRIVDLTRATFARVASPSRGVITVRIDW